MAAAPIPSLVDTVDSFYQWILQNVHAINPQRVFGGIVEARDWPPKGMTQSAPYLATLRDIPTRTKQSFYQPMITELVEWRWALHGDNIAMNSQSANRGDKYRVNVAIMQELLSAHNPGYCPKRQFNVTSDPVTNQAVSVVIPYDPSKDYLWWTIPEFSRKQDRQTGMIFTAGVVQVTSFAPVSQNLVSLS